LSNNQIVILLVDLVVIATVARIFGRLAKLVGQPPVVGEIAAGISAGPAVLGVGASTALFPPEIHQYLEAFANVGVAIFMFQVGMEVDRRTFSTGRRLVAIVSVAAYGVPFLLGVLLAITLLARHNGGRPVTFAFFSGAAFAVTAFPVLARILADRGILGTRVGQLSLAAAATNDVLAWSVLGVIVSVAGAQSSGQWRLAFAVPLLVALWLMRRLSGRIDSASIPAASNLLVWIGLVGALLCGAVTEWMGLHLIFGAFAFGLAFPRSHRALLLERTSLLSWLFMPIFFVTAGWHLDIGAMGISAVVDLVAIILVAVLGKFGGTYVAALCCGAGHREAGMLASLMNTRGLTELVILVVGVSLGLIDRETYSLMVIAALVTTAMTAPLLRLFGRRAGPEYGSSTETAAVQPELEIRT
jgi:Kef-type K+ transport system membrane component KefB